MRCPILTELPPLSPIDKTGWPRTEESLQLPDAMPDADDSPWPRVSIITPSYNRAGMIETAIQSVLNQNYPEVEHIIIDGGSADGTLDVLRKYPHLRVVSEPDQGIYDALNKGIRQAQGDILGFLNSDDAYTLGIFEEVAKAFEANPNVDVVWGGAAVIRLLPDGSMEHLRVTYPLEQPNLIYRFLNESPNFNACFFRRSVFDNSGLLFIKWKIVSDLEFMLRLLFGGGNFLRMNRIFYHYRVHEGSLTFGGASPVEIVKEEMCQVAEYFLEQKNISSEAKTAFRQMHTIWCLILGRMAFESGNYRLAVDYIRRAKEQDSRWFWVFLKKTIRYPLFLISEILRHP